MQFSTKLKSLMMILFLSATLAGCQTIEGAGEDIENAGDQIEDATDGQ